MSIYRLPVKLGECLIKIFNDVLAITGTIVQIACFLSHIRILPDIDQTISIVKDFEAIGISAIAVHGRTKDERPHDPVNKGKQKYNIFV